MDQRRSFFNFGGFSLIGVFGLDGYICCAVMVVTSFGLIWAPCESAAVTHLLKKAQTREKV